MKKPRGFFGFMVATLTFKTQVHTCSLSEPTVTVTRDVNDRITSIESAWTSIKKTTSATYNAENQIVDGSFTGGQLEDVVA